MKTTELLITKTLELNELYSNGLKELAKKHDVTPDEIRNILENPDYVPPKDNEELNQDIGKLVKKYDIFMTSILDEFGDVKDFGIGMLVFLSSYLETLQPNQIKSLSSKKMSDIILFLKLITKMNFSPQTISKEEEEFFKKFTVSVFEGTSPK